MRNCLQCPRIQIYCFLYVLFLTALVLCWERAGFMTRFGGCQPPPAFFTDIYFSQAAAAPSAGPWPHRALCWQCSSGTAWPVHGTLTKQLNKNNLTAGQILGTSLFFFFLKKIIWALENESHKRWKRLFLSLSLFWPCYRAMQDLSSPVSDQTHAPCIGSAES